MSFSVIRPQIKSLLQTVTKIQEVKGYPSLKFSGYPACYVIPSDNEADYETNRENQRVYAFIVRFFYETKNSGVENALTAMEDLIDTILDTLDREDLKGSDTRTIGLSLPTGYTFLNIYAHPSKWGELLDENLLMSEVIIKVKVSIDVDATV
jgi:hypothetical protein